MRNLFPEPRGVSAWRGSMFDKNPFSRSDSRAAAVSFFRPAARLCRKAAPAEKDLPASIPAALREKIGMAIRFWRVSQEITEDFVLRGRSLPGMDSQMTLNFAMALGNYSRFFLFSGDHRMPEKIAAALHAAFIKEMAETPAAMAGLFSRRGRRTPASEAPFAKRRSSSVSALRLASACAAAFGK